MNIPMIINNEKILVQSAADASLLSVLRKQRLVQVKRGCELGICGSCTVLMNDKPVPSCKIPVALAMNKEIITLEHFMKDEMYISIMKGFTRAGIKLCGYCNSGKIFAAKAILSTSARPTRAKIAEYTQNLSPCCTDQDTLINGILYAFEIHNKKGQ